jgi:hypothetical protein
MFGQTQPYYFTSICWCHWQDKWIDGKQHQQHSLGDFVWENHVLCFAKEKIDIVQIIPPLSCHFCRHGLALTSIQKNETHNIWSPPHITMLPKYKKITIKLLPNAFNCGRNHIHIYKVPSPTTSHIYKVKILNNNENEIPQMTKCQK